MKITLKCSCGAEAMFESGTYINGGGNPDFKGRIYQVEVRADRWLDDHSTCKLKPRIEQAST
jgi:hypothetical protein